MEVLLCKQGSHSLLKSLKNNLELSFSLFFNTFNNSCKLEISFILLPITESEAEFKEFEPRLKYGSLHFKLYQMFQDALN